MKLVEDVFKFLNKNCYYAVLRNYEGLPHKLNSRDIDIIISRKEFNVKLTQIIGLILKENYKIISLFKSDRMQTIICSYVNENQIEIIQFDFFFQTSLHGLIILNAQDVLSTRSFNGSIYYVSKEYEFLDKYLYLKFLDQPYPQKYCTLKEKISQSAELTNITKELFGCNTFSDLETLTSFQIRFKKIAYNFKKMPVKQLLVFCLFIWYHINNRLSYKGFSIGFSGPDGSGKTTVINEIIGELNKVYSDTHLFHFRPSLTLNLGEVAHKTKLKSEVDRNYSQPHRGEKTSVINSLTRLLYYSFDFILGYFFRVRPYLHKRSVVIFDRYFTDIISDSKRSKIFLNHKFLYFFNKLFIPKLDYNILLTANKYVILSRKQELDEEGIELINKKLDFLSKKNGYYLVKNNTTPTDAVQKILTIVFEAQHKKNMKRIEQ